MHHLKSMLIGLILFAVGAASSSAETQVRIPTRLIADGVEITLSDDWRVATRKQIVQFEVARDSTLAQSGLRPTVDPKEVVTFQAEVGSDTNAGFVGVTVMPVGEASQDQVAQYSSDRIRNLGARLIEQHRKALLATRCTGVSFSEPALVEVGGKKAIGFMVQFTTPDGVSRAGSKHQVYMRNATVVLTSAAPVVAPESIRNKMSAALASLRLDEK